MSSSPPSAAAEKRKSLRKNSASNPSPKPSSFSLADIQKLISESEERIIHHVNEKFDLLTSKITNLETAIQEVKAVQVQQESDLSRIKNIIAGQQHQIEAFEERERRCNLIFSNVPETPVTVGKELLTEDKEKVVSLVKQISPSDQEVSEDVILETTRLGRGGRNPRILKVKLQDVQSRNNILHHARNLNSSSIQGSFGRVFVNKDMSLLRRQEEKRLRERYKELKNLFPEAPVKIRNGKLFLGQAIKDCVDFHNQLF